MTLDPLKALKIALGMLGVALLLKGSLLAVLVAASAAVPSGYAMWAGAQEEGQRTYAYGVVLLVASMLLATFLLFAWLR
jgi:hypothetical protein